MDQEAIQSCGGCEASASAPAKRSTDWLLIGSAVLIVAGYGYHVLLPGSHDVPGMMAHAIFELVNTMWWGVLIGVLMISVLARVPREFVMSALGTGRGAGGVVRATLAGTLLDLCSHGVLMVGAKLYERGASTAQTVAFLVSSPWNSFSLLILLVALVGWQWMLVFTALSMLVAVAAGLAVDHLERRGTLPANAHQRDLPDDFDFWPEARNRLREADWSAGALMQTLAQGVRESRMVVRWILFGIVLAAVFRGFVSADQFAGLFGPTWLGLGITMLLATVLEVCSEGSTPIAADILNRAGAPGNSFAFLMGGVATDYTEVVVLREATGSWRVALALPLIVLPQVIVLGVLLNGFAG